MFLQEIYANRVQSCNSCQFRVEKNGHDQKLSIRSSDPDNVVQITLSDYAKRLDGKVRERYLKKISTTRIDHALIEGKHFEPDCLPSVESTDLLCYLVRPGDQLLHTKTI